VKLKSIIVEGAPTALQFTRVYARFVQTGATGYTRNLAYKHINYLNDGEPLFIGDMTWFGDERLEVMTDNIVATKLEAWAVYETIEEPRKKGWWP